MKVLLLEDNVAVARSLGDYLEAHNCVVDYAYSGRACLELVASQVYDVLVLDISMPGLNGLDVCQKIRQQLYLPTPIIFLTARDTLSDKLTGFEMGADDYLVKPFSPAELLCRLQALNSRGPRKDVGIQQFGDLVIDHALKRVTRANREIKLVGIQFEILTLLLQYSPHTVSKEKLELELWADQGPPQSDALRTHIYRLRSLLDKPFEKTLIKTDHGKGYRLELH